MTENKVQSSDFISLSTIKLALIDFLRIFFKSADFAGSAINRRKVLFIVCCIAGLGAGYLYYLLKPPYYKTEMIVQSTGINRNIYGEIINNLNNLAVYRSYSDLASELNISNDLSSKILNIQAIYLTTSQRDTSNSMPLKIEVKLKENRVSDSLQNALLNYLNNNAYIKRLTEGQKKISQEKLQFISLEQARLDSLKDSYNQSLTAMKMPATFYNNALNPADLYRHSLSLANQKDSIQRWLINESEAIQLVDGFKRPENFNILSKWLPILAGLAIGITLGFIFSILAAVRRRFY